MGVIGGLRSSCPSHALGQRRACVWGCVVWGGWEWGARNGGLPGTHLRLSPPYNPLSACTHPSNTSTGRYTHTFSHTPILPMHTSIHSQRHQDATELVAGLRAAHHKAQSKGNADMMYAGLDLIKGVVRNNLQVCVYVCVCWGGSERVDLYVMARLLVKEWD